MADDEHRNLLGINRDPYREKAETRSNFFIFILVAIFALAAIVAAFSVLSFLKLPWTSSVEPNQCTTSVQYRPYYTDPKFAAVGYNPEEVVASARFAIPPGSIFIKNVTILTVNDKDEELVGYDVIVVNGEIKNIGKGLAPPPDFHGPTVEGQLRYLTPGLIDMHSHAAVISFPSSFGLEDSNEMTGPTTPQVRVIDALHPSDPAIQQILSGGVTTSLILPGSANVVGGQGAIIKMRGSTVDEMLVRGAKWAIKMACGENPKRVYGQGKGESPGTRMGVGWQFRKLFYAAEKLRAEQKSWDCAHKNGKATGVRPSDIELEHVVDILEGKALLMVHCYMVQDLEMMIRTSWEFNFTIAAFHHALEAWKIPKVLKEKNIGVATFVDHWGFKMEAYDGSTQGLKKLLDGGVNALIKTDHPVIYAKYFMHEAAKATYYGLTEKQALRAVTMAPAKTLQLDHRLGSVEVGKDGDLVIWDRNPFQIGARPTQVVIEGKLLLNNNYVGTSPVPDPHGKITKEGPNPCEKSDVPQVVVGFSDLTQDKHNLTIVVEKGIVTCYDLFASCNELIDSFKGYYNIYRTTDSFITPGFVQVHDEIGQNEVQQEGGTSNGRTTDSTSLYRVIDGVRLSNYKNRKIEAAFKGGVLSTVGISSSANLLSGQASAFFTIPGASIIDAEISPSVALTVYFGNAAKSKVGSISAEVQYLRDQFKTSNSPVIKSVLNGTLVLLAVVNQVDEIESLLRLKSEFGFKMAIKGGAEAYLIAKRLATENVPVVLNSRVAPDSFETFHASDDGLKILFDAGVKIGISMPAADLTRNLRWEAAYAMERGIPVKDALSMITKNVAEIFDISDKIGSIIVDKKANFVIFDGHPLSIKTHPLLVVASNTVQCDLVQF